MQLLPAEKYAIQAIPGAEMVWFGRLERGMVWETLKKRIQIELFLSARVLIIKITLQTLFVSFEVRW